MMWVRHSLLFHCHLLFQDLFTNKPSSCLLAPWAPTHLHQHIFWFTNWVIIEAGDALQKSSIAHPLTWPPIYKSLNLDVCCVHWADPYKMSICLSIANLRVVNLWVYYLRLHLFWRWYKPSKIFIIILHPLLLDF